MVEPLAGIWHELESCDHLRFNWMQLELVSLNAFFSCIQMPTHSKPFYWQYSEGTECADMDAINTHIPLTEALQQVVLQQ